MAYSFSRNERIFLQKEATFGVIPNSTGAATVAGANCCRHTKAVLTPDVALLVRHDKTGSRTVTQGVAGRKTAKWSFEADLAANGVAGVVPDCDPILAAIFGGDGVVVASTSVTYSMTDLVKSFSMYSLRTPVAVMQRVGFGCVVQDATFNLGQDIATMQASGEAVWVLDSVNLATTDTPGKGGLTAWPATQTIYDAAVTNGGIIAGFTGSATFDSNVLANLRSATLRIGTANAIVKDTFGKYYGDTAEGDVRAVMLSFSLYDDDAAGTTNLYQKAITKTPINVALQIGTVAGSKFTFTVKGVQLAVPNLEDGARRWSSTFGDSQASGSSLTALDEVSLAIT